jgi:hypothetical protein
MVIGAGRLHPSDKRKFILNSEAIWSTAERALMARCFSTEDGTKPHKVVKREIAIDREVRKITEILMPNDLEDMGVQVRVRKAWPHQRVEDPNAYSRKARGLHLLALYKVCIQLRVAPVWKSHRCLEKQCSAPNKAGRPYFDMLLVRPIWRRYPRQNPLLLDRSFQPRQ